MSNRLEKYLDYSYNQNENYVFYDEFFPSSRTLGNHDKRWNKTQDKLCISVPLNANNKNVVQKKLSNNIKLETIYIKKDNNYWEQVEPMGKDNLGNNWEEVNLLELLKSEQDKTSALIDEIIEYRCKNENLEAKDVLIQLYIKGLTSGSYIKKYLNINQYELLNLLSKCQAEYKIDLSTQKEREENLNFLRSLLNE